MFEIGSSLRAARRQQGLEYGDVEAATLIRARYLEAIELERFEVLPVGSYRRSFVREYAEFLGLDGEVYAAEYELKSRPTEPASTPAPSIQRVPWLQDLPLRRILVVGAVAALFGVAVWLLGSSGGGSHIVIPRPSASVRRRPSRPAAPAPVSTRAASRPSEPSYPPLVLTAARGACWMLVRIGSSLGPTIYEHTLQPGQTVRFGLRRRLWIRVGAAWNLDARIGRRDITPSLPPTTGDVFASVSGLTISAR